MKAQDVYSNEEEILRRALVKILSVRAVRMHMLMRENY